MSQFEQQRRQKLLDEDFYLYQKEVLVNEIRTLSEIAVTIDDPFMGAFVDNYYQQFCLEYTAGKPIIDLLPYMEEIIKYTIQSINTLEKNFREYPDGDYNDDNDDTRMMGFTLLYGILETEKLSNLLGMCILFERQDWFEVIVRGVDLEKDMGEKTVDSLIAMKVPNYPITEDKTQRSLSFRTPLYKAIHAKTEKETLAFLDEYLRRWYDGLRKAGYTLIDNHLKQQGASRDYCSFYGYWCFEAAAVAYLKNIDDSSLHRFLYYPKDMIAYARNKLPS